MSGFTLYGSEVTGTFNPDSRFRYIITDPVVGFVDKRVRGVTTVIGEVLDKPGLRLWARDEMAKRLMGLEFGDEGEPVYNSKNALIKEGIEYGKPELQEFLDKSFNAYRDKSDRGKDIGTMTHDFVAQFLKGDLKKIDASTVLEQYTEAPEEFTKCVIKAVESFMVWWNSLKDKELLGTENIIYSRKYEFSGTYDLKCRIGKKVYMLDVKTTNRSQTAPLGIYPEYFMQLGGYIQADEEESGTKFDDCGVINVGKDGKLSIACASDIGLEVEDCKNSFVYAVTIHNWLNKLSKLTRDGKLKSHLGV